MKAPTAESYWVAARLLAGKHPGTKPHRMEENVAALLGAGVRTFLDLTAAGELLPYAHLLPANVSHQRIALLDRICPYVEQVQEALSVIERTTERGMAYVHCYGGCGRTGVIVGCYLVEQGIEGDEALTRVHELTRRLGSVPCPETPDQITMLRRWLTCPGHYDRRARNQLGRTTHG
jgi:hypothetical protein